MKLSHLVFVATLSGLATDYLVAAGQFVYVANHYNPGYGINSISAFLVNPDTGAFTPVPGSPFPTGGDGVRHVAIHPSGRFVYACNFYTDSIAAYNIDGATGRLAPVPGSPFPVGDGPGAIAFDPTGRFAYVPNAGTANVSGYSVHAVSGALIPLPGSPYGASHKPDFAVVHPTGSFAYVSNMWSIEITAYRIQGSGDLERIGAFALASLWGPGRMAMHPSGRFLYVANQWSTNVAAYIINPTTGLATKVSGSPFLSGQWPYDIAVHPSGRFLYVPSAGANSLSGFAINAESGELTPVEGSPFQTGTFPSSVAVDPAGRFAYVGNASSKDLWVYSISPVSGRLTRIGTVQLPAGSWPSSIAVAVPPFVQVRIDLKPGSNPNCVNPKNKGNVPVALYGTPSFNVYDVNRSTLRFGGAVPLRCSVEDAPMERQPGFFVRDGIPDLVCHFDTQQVAWPSSGSDCGTIELVGYLWDGTTIAGSDTACLAGGPTCEAGKPMPIQ